MFKSSHFCSSTTYKSRFCCHILAPTDCYVAYANAFLCLTEHNNMGPSLPPLHHIGPGANKTPRCSLRWPPPGLVRPAARLQQNIALWCTLCVGPTVPGVGKTWRFGFIVEICTFLLTAAEFEGAGVRVHGEILQLHGALGRYGQPEERRWYISSLERDQTLATAAS